MFGPGREEDMARLFPQTTSKRRYLSYVITFSHHKASAGDLGSVFPTTRFRGF
jgi:hypothetical protein